MRRFQEGYGAFCEIGEGAERVWNVADGNCCGAERRKGKSAVRVEMILCNGDGAKVHKLCKFAPSLLQEWED